MGNVDIVRGRYVVTLSAGLGISPPDDTVRYYGNGGAALAGLVTANLNRVYIPRTGTITRVDIVTVTSPTQSSGENSTVAIRLNDTTDTVISTALETDALTTVLNLTGLTIAVSAGDFIELKVTFAEFLTTNPTLVYLHWMFEVTES